MHKPTDESGPNQPALIVTHGATRRKVRPLNRDIVVIGGGPGCDVGLLSPEVANVHCVLVRLPGGWRLRDTSGRATRVNGSPVSEEELRDGDVIQIGAFSFRAQLPASAAALKDLPVPKRVARLAAARRRLTDLALRMRARLREAAEERRGLAREQAHLSELETKLRVAHDEHLARQGELDAYARHLRREMKKCRETAAEMEAEVVRQRVELAQERRRMEMLQGEMRIRQVESEAAAADFAEALAAEREALEQDREAMAREREYLDQQRQELMRLRGAPRPQPTGDTHFDEPGTRLESARRLLREIAERRRTK